MRGLGGNSEEKGEVPTTEQEEEVQEVVRGVG